jgi:hypothetical protein
MSPTDYGASLYVIYKPQTQGGQGPRWAVAPETKKSIDKINFTKKLAADSMLGMLFAFRFRFLCLNHKD